MQVTWNENDTDDDDSFATGLWIFFDFFKKIKKIGFFWFKSDFFDLNQKNPIFLIFLKKSKKIHNPGAKESSSSVSFSFHVTCMHVG